jgi:hypothetical protein
MCENCGEEGYAKLQAAHVLSRRYAATRTDEANAFCLCARCHMRFTEHADEWMGFIDATIGRAEYNRLKGKALDGVRTSEAFWRDECARLAELLKKVTA